MNGVSRPAELDRAWSREYERLAREFRLLLPEAAGSVVELGCGRGQLTFRLATVAPRLRIVAVDSFQGPYAGGAEAFTAGRAERRLRGRVTLERDDVLAWLHRRKARTCDAAISNEFLCELDAEELRDVLSDCHRILRPGGATVHGFASPTPRTAAQRLVIEANVDPRWTETRPKEWFSPPPGLVAEELRRAGFRKIATAIWPSGLRVRGEAARRLLRNWNVRPGFWRRYEDRLASEGLEFPDWVLVAGRKA